MATATTSDSVDSLARKRTQLTIAPGSQEGKFVVKDRESGRYFSLGAEEHFLLLQCDGLQSPEAIRAAFEARFGEPLSESALREFEEMGLKEGLLERSGARSARTESPESRPARTGEGSAARKRRKKSDFQNVLYFRCKLFDPDAILNWLEPKIRFVWTPTFFLATVALLGWAAVLFYELRFEWLSTFPTDLNWQTVAILWTAILVATLLHEFAHGLTCKHFGGEVHEIGAIFIVGTPCMYCNVSDAWLFPERWKRLLVSVAGGYLDLCLSAIFLFVWRLTPQDTLLSTIAWMISTVCLTRSFFNFNPLLRMDGYYVLLDLVDVPNLYERGQKTFKALVQHYLWGGPAPKDDPNFWILVSYGLAQWLFFVSLLSVMIFTVFQIQGGPFGLLGMAISAYITFYVAKTVLGTLFGAQFWKMVWYRGWRMTGWAFLLLLVAAWCSTVTIQDRTTGAFQIRPGTRVEIAAPEAGFLEAIELQEGDRVSVGTPIARVRIPDLEANVTKKKAELVESEANLRRLTAGPRPEQVLEQRRRVERSVAWRDLAKGDLQRSQDILREDLVRFDRQLAQGEAEKRYSDQLFKHAQQLKAERAISGEQFLSEQTQANIAGIKLEEIKAQRGARAALGTSVAEAELARRDKELADHAAELRLLEAGTRPEEIDAERARLARLREDLRYLEELSARSVITSPIEGILTTARLREKNGMFVAKGGPVCIVEELTSLVAEITIQEEQEFGVAPGQKVELRPRAMTSTTVHTEVDRKAPSAVLEAGKPQGTVMVYCRLEKGDAEMLSGMTGFAWIYGRERTLGSMIIDRAMRYLRTEFWL